VQLKSVKKASKPCFGPKKGDLRPKLASLARPRTALARESTTMTPPKVGLGASEDSVTGPRSSSGAAKDVLRGVKVGLGGPEESLAVPRTSVAERRPSSAGRRKAFLRSRPGCVVAGERLRIKVRKLPPKVQGLKLSISDYPGDTDWMCGPVNGVSVYIFAGVALKSDSSPVGVFWATSLNSGLASMTNVPLRRLTA